MNVKVKLPREGFATFQALAVPFKLVVHSSMLAVQQFRMGLKITIFALIVDFPEK